MRELEAKLTAYLNGELEGAALAEFEQALADDPELQSKLEAMRSTHLAHPIPENAPEIGPTENDVSEPERHQPPPVERSAPARNTWIGGMLVGIGLLLAGWLGSRFFQGTGDPAAAFSDNFAPPKSLVADLSARIERDSGAAIPVPACLELLESADKFYQNGELESAQEPLLLLALDTIEGGCRSDAWFYLGIIRLQMEDPGTSIQCFTKIENFERYGEDIQWFTALAFVKMAEQRPDMSEKARRSVERVIQSTNSEERRSIATKMLEKLSK